MGCPSRRLTNENTAAGIARRMETIQMQVTTITTPPLAVCNLRMGSTIAKKRSALKAVRVNTETPIEISFALSDIWIC